MYSYPSCRLHCLRRDILMTLEISRPMRYNNHCVGMWLSLVERLVRDQEAAGSNPVIPTI